MALLKPKPSNCFINDKLDWANHTNLLFTLRGLFNFNLFSFEEPVTSAQEPAIQSVVALCIPLVNAGESGFARLDIPTFAFDKHPLSFRPEENDSCTDDGCTQSFLRNNSPLLLVGLGRPGWLGLVKALKRRTMAN